MLLQILYRLDFAITLILNSSLIVCVQAYIHVRQGIGQVW